MVHIIKASELGARLDSNVYTGGGTDDTAIIQGALDRASGNGGVHLIIDGAALVSTLSISSNTTIECLNTDCGFFLKDNINAAMLRNRHWSFNNIQDSNITLRGGTYNFNGAKQEHHVPINEEKLALNATSPTFDLDDWNKVSWVFGFEFCGVEGFTIEGVTLRDQRTWAVLLANWKNVTITDVRIDLVHEIHGSNQDGIHIWGPGQFLSMRNIRGRTGDDFIALGPDEHDLVSGITDVLIDGVMLDNAAQGIRVMSRGQGRMDRVTVRNVTGTYNSYGFGLSCWTPNEHAGNWGSVVFENIDLRPLEPTYTYRPNFLFHLGGRFEHLIFRNIQEHHPINPRTLFEFSGPFYEHSIDIEKTHIDKITIDGLSVIADNEYTRPLLWVDAEIDMMVIRHAEIQCTRTQNAPFIQVDSNGKIGTLLLDSVLTENVPALLSAKDGKVGRQILQNIQQL